MNIYFPVARMECNEIWEYLVKVVYVNSSDLAFILYCILQELALP